MDLSGALLDQVTFFKADLRTVKLDGARMNMTIMVESRFGDRDLSKMSFPYCQFTRCDLRGASFQEADVHNACFMESQLEGADFQRAIATNCLFQQAKLAGAKLMEANLHRSIFPDADLTGVNAAGADLFQSTFDRALLVQANLKGTELTEADFSHADISEADFSHATLFRTIFHRTKEEGTTFTDRSLAKGDDEKLAQAEDWEPQV